MGEQVVASFHGGIAQLGEHLPCKQGVKGSNPFISTIAMSDNCTGDQSSMQVHLHESESDWTTSAKHVTK